MLVGGAGAGIGNFLVFFPAAYYFAVFGGRDVLVIDDSLIGELCSVLHCGFPKYQSVAAAYPGVLTAEAFRTMGHAKAYDFHRFVGGMVTYDQTLVQADGYKYMSGWYMDRAHTEACAAVVSGCHGRDVGCRVGSVVGCCVGCCVGWLVGCSVGSTVGCSVGCPLGSTVGCCVG
jgi:hypothetical protein